MNNASEKIIASILRYDAKITSYKIALVRAINDVVLSFPDVKQTKNGVAVPLRMLAEFWIAYYWPFADDEHPIIQGQQAQRQGQVSNDMSFRAALSELRRDWQKTIQHKTFPSDGFFLISEFKTPRRRASYPLHLQSAYDVAVAKISRAIQQPIRYAGKGEWEIFDKPNRASELSGDVAFLPGSKSDDVCLVINSALWESFRDMSLWIEALSIHEWCLFSERVTQQLGKRIERGLVYSLLTSRPDNRRPLTWERNQIEVLMIEGVDFVCPWTRKTLSQAVSFDIDHLLPLAVYPTNELWNLLPADRKYNQHIKRDRIPNSARLLDALPFIAATYINYEKSKELSNAIHEDANVRFSELQSNDKFPSELAKRTVRFIEEVANARNAARF